MTPRLQPTRLLRPWDFPGKSTGVGCHLLIRYVYSNLWYIHTQKSPLCLGYHCGVSGYGLLNIVHLCRAYYAVPFPRMEFYHFICIEQGVKCICIPMLLLLLLSRLSCVQLCATP